MNNLLITKKLEETSSESRQDIRMLVRKAVEKDSDAIWAILEPSFAGETYTQPRDMSREEALAFLQNLFGFSGA